LDSESPVSSGDGVSNSELLLRMTARAQRSTHDIL
jgi:hypothetical protein